MTTINMKDAHFFETSLADPVGRKFYWKGGLYRAVSREHAKSFKRLFTCGLIEELTKENLIPFSEITDLSFPGYAFVTKQEEIPHVTYPFEWTFSMLKDAALLVLKINGIARRYGYELKDCHGFNIVFAGCRPVFVDLGSFSPVYGDSKGWIAYEEFLRFYLFTLRIWSRGDAFLAARILASNRLTPVISYLLFRSFLLRKSRRLADAIAGLRNNFFKFKLLSAYPPERIRNFVPSGRQRILDFLLSLHAKHLLPFQKVNLAGLARRIKRTGKSSRKTLWKDYHSVHQLPDGSLRSTPRFDRIIELLNGYRIGTVLELGGNQGVFARHVLEKTDVRHIICTDYEEQAVDVMYNMAKNKGLSLTPAVLDVVVPVNKHPRKVSYERFAADAVVALALTHHLVLSQGFPLEYIMEIFNRYAKKYVFLEFMPLGLFGKNGAPVLPDWYNKKWFTEGFKKFFTLLHEEQLEENRILFIGIKKTGTVRNSAKNPAKG